MDIIENNPDSFSETEQELYSSQVLIGEGDPLSLYLKQISQYPLLSKQEELEIGKKITLFKQAIEDLDNTCNNKKISKEEYHVSNLKLRSELGYYRDKMITSNLRLVVSIAKKYQHRGLSFLDLIDEGNIGLIEAVERFDYTKKCKFSTYGTWWIQQAVIKALADKGRAIRIPIHVLNSIRKCFSISKYLTQELGREPHYEEIAECMSISTEKVKNLMQYSGEIASLDVTVDDDQVTCLSDLIYNDGYTEPFENVFNITLLDILENSLAQLNKRERKIIELRFGLFGEGPLTLEEIGKLLSITRERVRQIQNKAIEKLKQVILIKELEDVF